MGLPPFGFFSAAEFPSLSPGAVSHCGHPDTAWTRQQESDMRKTSENSTHYDTSYSSIELLHGTFRAKAVARERKPIHANEILKKIFRKL